MPAAHPRPGSECMGSAERRLRARKAVEQAVGTDVRHAEQVLGTALGGGKGLRALVAHVSADYCGLPLRACDRLAAAIEMIHVASLLHDDVVDESATRRHRPSANAVFGNTAAVLAGDFLYSRASQLLCESGSLALLAELADATNRLAEGELIELAAVGEIAGESAYFDMIGRKTAALFAAAAACGPAVSGAQELADPLRTFGFELGLAFQITDDCIDYAGDERTAGKETGADFAAGKATLPLLCGLASAAPDQQRKLRELFAGRAQPEAFASVSALLDELGAVSQARAHAAEHAAAAAERLDLLPPAPQLDLLRELAQQAPGRDR